MTNSIAQNRKLLIEQKAAIEKELESIRAKSEPLRKERQDLRDKIEPVDVRINALNKMIKDLEQPHVGQLETQLNAINKALNDKVMRIEEEAAS